MSLKDLSLQSTYRTGEDDLLSQFYIPCLSNSTRYDRAVGYFSSSILNYISNGLYKFIVNGGKIRLICGINLSSKDIKNIRKGYEKKAIKNSLNEEIDAMLKNSDQANIKNLCWLIKNNKLDIRIAVRNFENDECFINTIYHEKFGIFYDDEGNQIAFTGSVNESVNGWKFNFESIDVFWNWREELFDRVKNRISYFEKLWQDLTNGVQVYNFPKAEKNRLIKAAPKEPIDKTYSLNSGSNSFTKVSKSKNKEEEITPREYQEKAIKKWKNNKFKGLFEMATGTGKTITAIFAIQDFVKQHSSVLVIIVCPYQHLVDQWQKEIDKFGYSALHCYKNRNLWEEKLIKKIIDLNVEYSKVEFVITTSATSSSSTFQRALNRINKEKIDVLLVGDEAHNLGADSRRKILRDEFKGRIGLSATPKRWYDKEGTNLLYKYFNGVIFEYGLEKAIEEGFLTPYEYKPILVELTGEEFEEYKELSVKIARKLNAGMSIDDEGLTYLMLKRSKLINSAQEKMIKFENLMKKDNNLKHTLVYTSPNQIEEVQNILSEKNIFYQRFTAREDEEQREKILDLFSEGEVGVLVAMHCLDEGVNVPATQKAYILASSSNPKEFIQRRGRVLRTHLGKEKAIIYDFIAIPPDSYDDFSSIRSILKKELNRFREFADIALNKYKARKKIFDIAEKYNLLDEV